MAEVVGIAAAAAQFAELTVKFVKIAKEIYDQVQDAPEQIARWVEEVEELRSVFIDIERCPELQTRDISAILKRCGRTIQELCKQFDEIKFSPDDPLGHRTWRAVVGIAKEAEISKLFEELERTKSIITVKTNVENLNQQRQIRSDIRELMESNSAQTEEEKCLQSLFVTDPIKDRDDIIDAKGDICAGTCEWITLTSEYETWDQNAPHLLWISAPPGMGKTYMAIYLSKYLEAIARKKPSTKVLFFFCDDKNKSRNTAVNILRGLLFQLITHQKGLTETILEQWKTQKSGLFQESSLNALWRIFEDMIDKLDAATIYCVIDALDECDEASLSSLLRKFEALSKSRNLPSTKLKLICLSRRYPERIPQSLSLFLKVELDMMPAGKEDTRRFISQRVLELGERKEIPPKLHHHIEQVFQQKSENTFLWISFMAKDLENTPNHEIERSLESYPQGLDAVYSRLLSQIATPEIPMISKMLSWILVAVRPLRVPELCEAIDIEPTEALSREEVCMSLIRSCGHILQTSQDKSPFLWYVTHERRVSTDGHMTKYWQTEVTFLHQSAKDYLSKSNKTDPRWKIQSTNELHEIVSNQLIGYLSKLSFSITDKTPDHMRLPLGNYSVSSWYLHFKELSDVTKIITKNKHFFGKPSKIRCDWHGEYKGSIPLLHMASRLGLVNLTKWCLDQREFRNWLFRKYYIDEKWHDETPLHLSCINGHVEVFKLLLNAGADPVAGGVWTFLFGLEALSRDSLRMIVATKRVEKRLKNYFEGCFSLYFGHACKYGNEEACRFLVEDFGCDPNEGNLLSQALSEGQVELARTFVSEWHLRTDNHFDLLVAALENGDYCDFKNTLDFLINDCSIDVNAVDGDGCNLLCQILTHGPSFSISHDSDISTSKVKMLAQAGLNLAGQNRRQEMPLHCAALGPNLTYWVLQTEVIQLVLDSSHISINAVCGKGRTVLHHYTSNVASVKDAFEGNAIQIQDIQLVLCFLLDLGVDRHMKDNDGDTAMDILRRARDHSLILYGSKWVQIKRKRKLEKDNQEYHQLVESGITILETYSSVPMP